jgi:hypothetical protein
MDIIWDEDEYLSRMQRAFQTSIGMGFGLTRVVLNNQAIFHYMIRSTINMMTAKTQCNNCFLYFEVLQVLCLTGSGGKPT